MILHPLRKSKRGIMEPRSVPPVSQPLHRVVRSLRSLADLRACPGDVRPRPPGLPAQSRAALPDILKKAC